MSKPQIVWLMNELGIAREGLKTSFGARLRLQKASFLLNYLSVQPFTKYNFNLYLRGPYSSRLASEYYDLDGISPAAVDLSKNEKTLLEWFATLDEATLEVASSILLINEYRDESGGDLKDDT